MRTEQSQKYSEQKLLTYEPVYVSINVSDVGYPEFASKLRSRFGIRRVKPMIEKLLLAFPEVDISEILAHEILPELTRVTNYRCSFSGEDVLDLEDEIVKIILAITEELGDHVYNPESYLLHEIAFEHTMVFRKIQDYDYH